MQRTYSPRRANIDMNCMEWKVASARNKGRESNIGFGP